jgi:hypothetical protein
LLSIAYWGYIKVITFIHLRVASLGPSSDCPHITRSNQVMTVSLINGIDKI